MLLRHATPIKNLPAIQKAGLLTSKSKGKLPVVWLHSPGATHWALVHTCRRHHCRVQDVVVIEMSIPRKWLRRSRKKLWACPRDIEPGRFRRVVLFQELSSSPLE